MALKRRYLEGHETFVSVLFDKKIFWKLQKTRKNPSDCYQSKKSQ